MSKSCVAARRTALTSQYIAHKLSNPEKYPPSPATLSKYPAQRDLLSRFPPTKTKVQIFDNAAHVVPTLAWTTVAKFVGA